MDKTTKVILIALTVGVWVLVLQTAGVVPAIEDSGVRSVRVENVVEVAGAVDVQNTIDVQGSVSVDNPVDVDIIGINGWAPANYHSYTIDGVPYHSLGTQ